MLSLDDEDYVKQLKIFSLNSAPVKLKYQVNSVDQWCPGGPEEIEVFCTWNQFFWFRHRELNPGPLGESQVSSPLDHIGGWPGGDRGFSVRGTSSSSPAWDSSSQRRSRRRPEPGLTAALRAVETAGIFCCPMDLSELNMVS